MTQQPSARSLKIPILVACAVVGIAAVYMLSDVFRAKASRAYESLTEWTPENIAADPDAYLTFCEERLASARQQLLARRIAVKQLQGQVAGLLGDSTKKIDSGAVALDELTQLYKTGSFPVTWQSRQLDESAVRAQVVSIDRQARREEALSLQCREAMAKLSVQEKRIEDADSSAKEQQSELKVQRQILKVNRISAEIKDTLVGFRAAIGGVLEATSAAAQAPLTLDELVAQKEAGATDREFEEIISRKK